ncbi:MAG: NAD(P)H-hydrate epimerase [Anaerolineae bacterium]|nr:NAD(P)H-hydrate epimerase [Anaerolineae bacterium]
MRQVPAITTAQIVEVDRAMMEDFGIALVQMMENAGRNLAHLAREMLGGQALGRQVLILAGAGNNGGGGLVAARHLVNAGAEVEIVLATAPGSLQDLPAYQLGILARMGLPIASYASGRTLPPAHLIVDALIGYGLEGNPRGAYAQLIRHANARGAPVLSLDTPSGLDTTTGIAYAPCIRAVATLTLALPKVGLLRETAQAVVGDLYLADIGVPPLLYRRMGLDVPPLFANGPVRRLQLKEIAYP